MNKQGLPKDTEGDFDIEALNITYDDAELPHLNATNVQDAIDKLKTSAGGMSTLAQDYANGGGTGGVNNTLGDPANGMDGKPLSLRVKNDNAQVLQLLNPDDTPVGGLTKTTDPNGLGPALVGAPDNSATLRAGVASGNGRHAVVEATPGANGVAHNGGNVYLRTGQQSDVGGNRGSIQTEFGSPAKRIVQEYLDSFGAAHIHGTDAEGLYITADGVGPVRGGTGLALVQDEVTPANSFVGLGVNDENICVATPNGFFPEATGAPSKMLGGDGSGPMLQSWSEIWSKLFGTRVGPAIVVAATISPTFGIHPLNVVSESQINTINPPVPGFTGTIRFLSDNVINFVASGGSNLHQSFNSVAGIPIEATFDGAEVWLK